MSDKAIVLDANILIRAVLGTRVRELILRHAPTTNFFAPDVAFADARKYLPALLEKRGVDSTAALSVLDSLSAIVRSLERELYSAYERQALNRIKTRDVEDWPPLACAMALGCPIWTEDRDFFGVGISIWSTDLVEQYLTAS